MSCPWDEGNTFKNKGNVWWRVKSVSSWGDIYITSSHTSHSCGGWLCLIMLTGQSGGGGSRSSHVGRAGGVWWRVLWGRGGGGERGGETRWNGLLHTRRQVLFLSGSVSGLFETRGLTDVCSLVVLTAGWSLRAASPPFLPAWRLRSSSSSGRRRSKRPWTGECLSKHQSMWGAETFKTIHLQSSAQVTLGAFTSNVKVCILFYVTHQAFMAHTAIYGAHIWREKLFIYDQAKPKMCRCWFLNGQKVNWKSDIM